MNLSEVMQHWHAQSPETLLARAGTRLPFWASLLLVVAIAYYLARLVWLLLPGPAPAAWVPPPLMAATTPAAASPGAAAGYAGISAAHLFGKADAEPAASTARVEDAPQTQLQLQLRGAIAALDERFAHAIIADGSGREKVYFIKDQLPGGATLQQVQADRVILSRGGILESLLLPRTSSGGTAAGSPSPAPPRPVARRPMPSMQEVVNQQAASIGDILRPQPFMPNGELKGYRVYPGRNRAQFVALGLRPGDLVTEINGLALNNPALAMETFRSLSNTSQVSVTIERDGQPQSLMLDANQVAAAAELPADEGAAGAPEEGTADQPGAGTTDATAQQ
ncbi:MAG: type II secretion system protein GspC [Gammaproteobacteria bacterium]|nr:type II secretion system protein GspC [Gammaproteobacteria bacterium]